MNRLLRQMRLALWAGLGFAITSPAWAQAPVPAGSAPPPVVVTEQGSTAPAAVVTEPTTPALSPEPHRPFQHLAETRPVRTAVHDQLHRHGLDCFATINTVGCTSLGAELTFIFGSCRAFFGEPCAPGGGLTHAGCGANGCP